MKFCQKQKPAVLQVSKARVLPGLVEQKLNLIVLGKEKVTFRECLEVAAHQAGLVWTLEGEEGDSDLDRDWQIHRGAVSLVIPQTTPLSYSFASTLYLELCKRMSRISESICDASKLKKIISTKLK